VLTADRKPRKFKDPGPSFCWECNKQLMLMRGGLFSFQLVRDRAGVEHRVHKQCLEPALQSDGVRKVA
jgi:hypothetical protein